MYYLTLPVQGHTQRNQRAEEVSWLRGGSEQWGGWLRGGGASREGGVGGRKARNPNKIGRN